MADEWVDPDDAPELTDEWFKKAVRYDGETALAPPGSDTYFAGKQSEELSKIILAKLEENMQKQLRPDVGAQYGYIGYFDE